MSLNWQDMQKCLCSSRWRTVRKVSNFRFPERGVALPAAIRSVISEPIEYILKRVCPCWISFKLVKALGYPHQNRLSKLLDPIAEYIPPIYSPMFKLENKHCLRPDDWLNFPLSLLFPSLTTQIRNLYPLSLLSLPHCQLYCLTISEDTTNGYLQIIFEWES